MLCPADAIAESMKPYPLAGSLHTLTTGDVVRAPAAVVVVGVRPITPTTMRPPTIPRMNDDPFTHSPFHSISERVRHDVSLAPW
jgi:hypothetical protein